MENPQDSRYNSAPVGYQNQYGYGQVPPAQNGQFPPTQNAQYSGQSAADIYANCRQNTPYGAPQYHYGAPMAPVMDPRYIFEQQQRFAQRKALEKDVNRHATAIGIILLAFSVVAAMFTLLLLPPSVLGLYLSSPAFSSAIGVFYSVVTIALTFFVGGALMKKRGFQIEIPFGKPKSKALLIIFMCVGGCVVANYITAIIQSLIGNLGVHFEYSPGEECASLLDVVLMFLGTAVIAPLTEEFAMRGVVMQSLRKHGDTFAIVSSAFVFAIFHGNFVQMIFAFMCGLLIGYAVTATESIWTGVIIHTVINSLSCVNFAVEYFFDSAAADTAYYVITAALVTVGIICTVIYLGTLKKEPKHEANNACILTNTQKFKCFIKNPAMIIATVVFFIEALGTVSFFE